MAKKVEEAGFDSIWLSDHFLPWSHKAGSRFPFSNVTCLTHIPLFLYATSKCKVASGVICPLFRYHPAIIAQYFAQLDYFFPNRVILGVGSGEAINELPFGYFPPVKERHERLIEAINLIRMLWEKEDYFTFEGKYYQLKNAMLYLRPQGKIEIIVSAAGPKASKIAGKIGDGVVFLTGTPDEVENTLIPSFKKGVEEAGKSYENCERILYYTVGVVENPELMPRVLRAMRRNIVWASLEAHKQPDPKSVDMVAEKLDEKFIMERGCFVEKVDDLIDRLEKYVKAGINYFVLVDFTAMFKGLINEVADIWPKKIFPYFNETYKD